MKPINDYIVERIRVDNIKSHYDFDNLIYIGDVTWKGISGYVIHPDEWYVFQSETSSFTPSISIIPPTGKSKLLVFFSTKSNCIFIYYGHKYNIGMYDCSYTSVEGDKVDPKVFYQLNQDKPLYFHNRCTLARVSKKIHYNETVDKLIKEWENTLNQNETNK